MTREAPPDQTGSEGGGAAATPAADTPVPVQQTAAPATAATPDWLVRLRAQLGWLLPTLRLSVAALWIVTGIVSLGLYPVEHSLALLARVGIKGALAPVALYGAAALDLVLGVATLAMSRRRALWLVQIAVIAGYTLIITAFLPEFWLHPYGPLLKNVPLLAMLALLYVLERR